MRRNTRWPSAVLLAGLVLCGASGCRSRAPAAAPAPVTPPSYPRSLRDYPWPHPAPGYEPLAARCPTPPGYTRAPVAPRSWGEWLRYLPLLPRRSPVRLENGMPILPGSWPGVAGVLDLDVRRSQECADVIFRLRAEYLRWAGREAEISFPAGGVNLIWTEWKRGVRPREVRGRLVLERTATPDASRASFDRYLASVFNWCGTATMTPMTRPASYAQLRPGDLLLHSGAGGGHIVLIADVMHDAAGHTWALIVQGYLPAQSAQLASPDGRQAWIPLSPDRPVRVPRWGDFPWSELREFR